MLIRNILDNDEYRITSTMFILLKLILIAMVFVLSTSITMFFNDSSIKIMEFYKILFSFDVGLYMNNDFQSIALIYLISLISFALLFYPIKSGIDKIYREDKGIE